MKTKIKLLSICSLLFAASLPAFAQGTAITYQGQLQNNGSPANGTYNFQFSLFTAQTGGTQNGSTQTSPGVGVTNGLFTVIIDFGPGIFTGATNWLQIGVETNGGASFATLTPRQELTPAPYAIYAESANLLAGGAAMGAGAGNSISTSGATDAFIGGGTANQIFNNSLYATIAGGENNTVEANSGLAFIGGGQGNQTSSGWSVISGGNGNVVGSGTLGSTIGGGYNNTNNGSYATIPGGLKNFVGGMYSFAAGQQARALTQGAFVWADSQNTPFSSTANDQFLVRARGGVGIGETNPAGALHITGPASTPPSSLPGPDNGLVFGTTGTNGYKWIQSFGGALALNPTGNNVGIGTTNPAAQLEVKGDIRSDGDLYAENQELFLGGDGEGNVMQIGTYDNSITGVSFVYKSTGLDTLGINCGPINCNGEFVEVNGLQGVQCYIGGDNYPSDVKIGSLNSNITQVTCWNEGNQTYMHLNCSSITIEGGSDLAEPFKISFGKGEVPQGAVVVIDDQNPGRLKMSAEPYDTRVAGVVSGANGINPGIQMQQEELLGGGKNVALTGRVYVLADAARGAIKPGDLLTTSSTPGHAMKVRDHARAQGAILGKAMTGLSEGKGMVLLLVTLQ